MASVGKIARRTFLIGAASIAGGVAVGYYYYHKPFPNRLTVCQAEARQRPFSPHSLRGAPRRAKGKTDKKQPCHSCPRGPGFSIIRAAKTPELFPRNLTDFARLFA